MRSDLIARSFSNSRRRDRARFSLHRDPQTLGPRSRGFLLETVLSREDYNQVSSRLWRADAVATSLSKPFDELYGYDALQRLTSMERGTLNGGHTGITGATLEQDWTLDETGNWLEFNQDEAGTVNDLAQSRTASKANEITGIADSIGSAWATPSYDRAGNMTGLPQPTSLTDSYDTTYDAWNRLVKVEDGETLVAGYSYDGANRLTTRIDNVGETRHFYYSYLWQVLSEYVDSESSTVSSSGSDEVPEREYVWGLRFVDDLILRDRDSDGSGDLDERLYALQDANWNVVALTDTNGAVSERYAYTAYGVSQVLGDDFTDRADSLYEWDYRYTGRELDLITGLQINRNRWLHVQLGNWITRDPIGYNAGDSNLYRYVNNQPTFAVDPSGNADSCPCNFPNTELRFSTVEKVCSGAVKQFIRDHADFIAGKIITRAGFKTVVDRSVYRPSG